MKWPTLSPKNKKKRWSRSYTLSLVGLLPAIALGIALWYWFSGDDKTAGRHIQPPFMTTSYEQIDSIVEAMPPDKQAFYLTGCQPVTEKSNKVEHTAWLILQDEKVVEQFDKLSPENKPLVALLKLPTDSLTQELSPLLPRAIADDSLYYRLQEFAAQSYKTHSTQMAFQPDLEPLLTASESASKTDTSFEADFLRRTKLNIESMHGHRLLTCVSIHKYTPKDSLAKKQSHKIYQSLIEQKVSCFYLPQDKPKLADLSALLHNLKDSLHFQGLLLAKVPDDLSDDDLLQLFEAGLDIPITKGNPLSLQKKIEKLIEEERLETNILHQKLVKILKARRWTGLDQQQAENTKPLNAPKISDKQLLYRWLRQASLTVVKDRDSLLPFKQLYRKRYCFITLGKNDLSNFRQRLAYYKPVAYRYYNPKHIDLALAAYKAHNPIVLSLNNLQPDTANIRKLNQALEQWQALDKQVVLVNFGNPETLKTFAHWPCLVQAYSNAALEQDLTAQLLFGGIAAQGRLPYALSDSLPFATGRNTKKTRLSYGPPQTVGLPDSLIEIIDSIAYSGVSHGAYPGCQIFLAKNGQVFYHKAIGFHTYAHRQAVRWTDLYDLASLTKIAATTIAAMKMIDLGKISLHTPIGNCFRNTHIEYTKIKPDTLIKVDTLLIREIKNMQQFARDWDTTHINDSMLVAADTLITRLTPGLNIFKVAFVDLLRHQSGVAPVLPMLPYLFYKANCPRANFKPKPREYRHLWDSLMASDGKHNQYFENYFSTETNDSCHIEIARNMYWRDCYFDTLWIETKQLGVFPRKVHQYTDMNMILVQQAIDSLNRKSIHDFMTENIYWHLGLQTTGFLPLNRFPEGRITPTEHDVMWRSQLLRGYVHDPSAAMLGGLSGNAGLFSNAHDLGILFQMLLNGGTYGGMRYLSKHIIKLFTTKQPDSERALGFDMKRKRQIIGKLAPDSSYGHTGYTGTAFWVDPENELVFVFLCNRNHTRSSNWRLINLGIIPHIHDAVYRCLAKDTLLVTE